MRIIIDPGHGGVWRPEPPKGDPGVVTADGKKIESYYTWIYSKAVKEIFEKSGFDVVLTREHDEYTVPLTERTKFAKEGDLFISIHFDSYIGGRRMIYFAGQNQKIRADSIKLAEAVDKHLKTGDLRPSTSSRFGRLYIDDNKCPSILVEVDRIDRADSSVEARLEFANLLLLGVKEYLGITGDAGGAIDNDELPAFSTPFQRVFIIEDGVQTQLSIERMSIVGDKLYIAVKK
jgi:N-acetylmuramoyl-L-alanine amidase